MRKCLKILVKWALFCLLIYLEQYLNGKKNMYAVCFFFGFLNSILRH